MPHPPAPLPLGRSVLVTAGAEPPAPWADAAVIEVPDAPAAQLGAVIDELHRAWATRTPVVVALAGDPARWRDPETTGSPAWELGAGWEPSADRLHHLVWANTYDAREAGELIWWWSRKATRLVDGLAEVAPGDGLGDVVDSDGGRWWIDGGPRDTVDPAALDGARLVPADRVAAGRLDAVPEWCDPTDDLAPDQLASVAHRGGPARIIAPAGSGKTRVLVARLRHMLDDRGYRPAEVTAVAYNVRARAEMETRLSGRSADVRTLNSLGYRVLTEGLGRRPEVIDERAVRSLIERAAREFLPTQRRANDDPVAPYLEGLTEVRLGLRSPTEVEAARSDVPGLAQVADRYREHLADRNQVDFDEQIARAVDLLLADGELRRRLQATHRHLLVDEFQDLTPAHVLLIRLLSAPTFDVFAVGDDDQVIYGHVGADPDFLVDFDRWFPGGQHHALGVNYRCPAAVVGGAQNLLSRNRDRIDKAISAGPDAAIGDDRLSVRTHPTADTAAEVTGVVEGWLADGVPPGDIAVLARVNALLLVPQLALSAAGIPADRPLDSNLLRRTGVRAALAWLRVATDPGSIDPDDLVEIARRPSRGLPRWAWKWLDRCRSSHEIAKAAERIDDERVAMKLFDLSADIDRLARKASGGATTAELLAMAIADVGLGAAMEKLDASKGGSAAGHSDDLEALVAVASLCPDPTALGSFLADRLSEPADRGGDPDAAQVTLATVHRVKGQEWPRVCVFGVAEGIVPHRLAVGRKGREEERRVLHVAITRSADETVVLAPSERPSLFLAEMAEPGEPPPDRLARSAGTSAAGRGRADVDRGDPMFEALREWRGRTAKEAGKPAYIVATDATLADIARRRPTSLDELQACDGIGPQKAKKWGDEILEVVAAGP